MHSYRCGFHGYSWPRSYHKMTTNYVWLSVQPVGVVSHKDIQGATWPYTCAHGTPPPLCTWAGGGGRIQGVQVNPSFKLMTFMNRVFFFLWPIANDLNVYQSPCLGGLQLHPWGVRSGGSSENRILSIVSSQESTVTCLEPQTTLGTCVWAGMGGRVQVNPLSK